MIKVDRYLQERAPTMRFKEILPTILWILFVYLWYRWTVRYLITKRAQSSYWSYGTNNPNFEKKMSKKDAMDIFGVRGDLTMAELKKKYREMAKKYHPDINPQYADGAKFRELAEAFDIMSKCAYA